MLTAVIIMLVLLLATVVTVLIKKALDVKAYPEDAGKRLIIQQRIKLQYELGHPAVNTSMQVYLLLNGTNVDIHKIPYFPAYKNTPALVATIPIAAIKEVLVHDCSTTAYETTTGRMIRFGELGLALKTKERKEAAALVINWNDGQASYETCFTKKGIGSVVDVQAVKERLLKGKQ